MNIRTRLFLFLSVLPLATPIAHAKDVSVQSDNVEISMVRKTGQNTYKPEWTRNLTVPEYSTYKEEGIKYNIDEDGKLKSSNISAIQFNIYKTKSGGTGLHFVTGLYKNLGDNKCLLDKVEQDGCVTEYKMLDNQSVKMAKDEEIFPLTGVADNIERFIKVKITHANKDVIVQSKDIVNPLKYNITLKVEGEKIPDFYHNKPAEFHLSGDDGEELAYGSSIMKKYIVQMMHTELGSTHYGILGAMLLKPYSANNDVTQGIQIKDNLKKDATCLIGIDVSNPDKDYSGVGEPNIAGLKTTVKADIPYNTWTQFGKSVKDYIMYINVEPIDGINMK